MDEAETLVLERALRRGWLSVAAGRIRVEVAHCVHCERLVLGPEPQRCACGGEFYPVSKTVPLGVPMHVEDMMGDTVCPHCETEAQARRRADLATLRRTRDELERACREAPSAATALEASLQIVQQAIRDTAKADVCDNCHDGWVTDDGPSDAPNPPRPCTICALGQRRAVGL